MSPKQQKIAVGVLVGFAVLIVVLFVKVGDAKDRAYQAEFRGAQAEARAMNLESRLNNVQSQLRQLELRVNAK